MENKGKAMEEQERSIHGFNRRRLPAIDLPREAIQAPINPEERGIPRLRDGRGRKPSPRYNLPERPFPLSGY